MCLVSHAIKKNCEASWLRVCYQRGLPRLLTSRGPLHKFVYFNEITVMYILYYAQLLFLPFHPEESKFTILKPSDYVMPARKQDELIFPNYSHRWSVAFNAGCFEPENLVLTPSLSPTWKLIHVQAPAEPSLEIPLPSKPEPSSAWISILLLSLRRFWLGF